MAYETYDPWQPLRDRLCWAVVIATTCAAILVYFHPAVRTITALVLCSAGTVLAVLSWRAPTKRESAWFVLAAVGALAAAGVAFALLS